MYGFKFSRPEIRYAQEYEDFTKEWEFQRKKEAAEKAERKKRLSFPGKYDVQLLRIMWRETRHEKRALFLICAGNSALLGIMLFLFAMKTTLGKGYGITDELPSQGLKLRKESARALPMPYQSRPLQ